MSALSPTTTAYGVVADPESRPEGLFAAIASSSTDPAYVARASTRERGRGTDTMIGDATPGRVADAFQPGDIGESGTKTGVDGTDDDSGNLPARADIVTRWMRSVRVRSVCASDPLNARRANRSDDSDAVAAEGEPIRSRERGSAGVDRIVDSARGVRSTRGVESGPGAYSDGDADIGSGRGVYVDWTSKGTDSGSHWDTNSDSGRDVDAGSGRGVHVD